MPENGPPFTTRMGQGQRGARTAGEGMANNGGRQNNMSKPFSNMFGKRLAADEKGVKDAKALAGSKAAPARSAASHGSTSGAFPATARSPQPGSTSANSAAQSARRSAAVGKAPTTDSSASSHWLMVGVFALSAVLGGGLAGLYLALQNADKPATEKVAGTPPAISVITPNMAAKREEVRNASPAAIASAKDQERLAVNSAAYARQPEGGATGGGTPAATPSGAATLANAASPAREAAATAGADELKQLTEQVIGALGALGRAERQGTVEEAASGAEQLRDSLADLVDAALASGKSDEEIRKLVAEALGSAGDENIPALLRDASGKVDITRLLASIMPSPDSVADVPMNAEERTYFNQLAAEAGQTTTADRPATRQSLQVVNTPAAKSKARTAPRASGRFFVRNGKRYTIVRKGDTLSDIAYAAYGDVLAYSAILRANRGRISTRNLKPGMRILIPDVNTARKTRKSRPRRQGATPPPSRATAVARKPASKAKASNNAGNAANRPLADRIITQPAAGRAVDPRKPVVKYTNFRSQRDARPVPLTPTQ